MRKILIGCTDFSRIIRENAFYVDKTRYIELMEGDAPYLMFIRPRRFGKTLFLNMMCDYYDINKKNQFEELFGKLYIGSHPTPEQGQYLILRLDFSLIKSYGREEEIETSFESYCRLLFQEFASYYSPLLGSDLEAKLAQARNAGEGLMQIAFAAGAKALPLFVVIDEYDNFANKLLAAPGGEEKYRGVTHGDSFFRSFFTILKGCTSNTLKAAVKRIFMTGVSPLVLDDVTSGFNIAKNISTIEAYNGLPGLDETEIQTALQEIVDGRTIEGTPEEHLSTMREYYNNYCFSKRGGPKHFYNTNMALYYLDYLTQYGYAPEQLVDTNSRTDYDKLRHLIVLGNRLNGNFNLLCDLAIDHCVQAELVDRFSLAELKYRNQFVSLLFYMGILTIDKMYRGELLFRVPNRTVDKILVSYIRDSLDSVGTNLLNLSPLKDAGTALAYEGNWRQMLEGIHKVIVDCTSIRDFMEGEKCVQIAHLLALQPLACYLSRTEHEASKGYLDLILKPNRRNSSGVLYTYVLEFKYLKDDATDAELAKAIADAREQLAKYAGDTALQSDCSGTTLTMLSVIYRKWDIAYCEAEGTLNLK